MLPGSDWGRIGVYLALLTGLAALTAGCATWSFRVYERTL